MWTPEEKTDMNPADTGREHLVTRAFVSLADTLVDEYDIIDLLDRLVRYSVEMLAADAAGIVITDARGDLRAVASSSEDAQLMELLQLQSNEGPCLDCVRSGTPVSVIDLAVPAAARRWPAFTAAVADSAAFRSVHALPLRLRGQAIGALNLFHRQPGPLPAVDLSLGQALADVATIGILSERAVRHGEVLNEQLQSALNSRVIIEQAKGVLTQKGNLSMDAAFDRLRSFARNRNMRLSEVARQVVEADLADDVVATRVVAPRTPRPPRGT
ncbi:GAF and ANTAR domain-containing protein [Pseudonocardia sp. GCM10023141]|uniref:GAF and ANTAR domain-containing protein n=1 Tax=Pseudonocardia sp. GCM10023141 TaxID=3252653 RepID=UPI00361EB588